MDVFRDVSHSDKDILAVMEVAVRLSKDAGLFGSVTFLLVHFLKIIWYKC